MSIVLSVEWVGPQHRQCLASKAHLRAVDGLTNSSDAVPYDSSTWDSCIAFKPACMPFAFAIAASTVSRTASQIRPMQGERDCQAIAWLCMLFLLMKRLLCWQKRVSPRFGWASPISMPMTANWIRACVQLAHQESNRSRLLRPICMMFAHKV